MGQALAAAATVRRRVAPRPGVGAVVVPASEPNHAGFVGATDGRSGAHAEILALAAAGNAARGATLYVTLEPCSHHGTTPPCADAVIAAGVARVVIAVIDPDPKVSGAGIARMREAGIDVTVGCASDAVGRQLAPYLHHRLTGRPFVVLKLATTLDGKTAAPDGTSQWITSEASRVDAHRLRADSDAILVGAGTAQADNPSLTVRLPAEERHPDDTEPLRIVLGTAPADAAMRPCLEMKGDLGTLLDELGAKGVLQLMVEGGASVAAAFHEAGLVNRYVLYMAPAFFAGENAKGMFTGQGANTLDQLWRGRIVDVARVGDDLRLEIEG
ncbi:MAG: bifunctional diaminohydroxyphosphoribosylaminopyrimidine deaminase/5-amino-6-(5-phosphoribosylamino)uracil reductase RibD [Acidimicrobiales bacterium]